MTELEFDNIVQERLNKTLEVLSIKGKEYRRNNNPLHNFEVGAEISGQTSERVLDGFMLKHYISYRDMLNDIDNNKYPTAAYVDEKIGDLINYLILIEASIKNKIKVPVEVESQIGTELN